MSQPATPIARTNLLIIAYQLDGLCSALRQTISCGLPLGQTTTATLLKLHASFAELHSGPLLANLPAIDSSSSPADILLFAEILRTTVGAFLSPDEITTKQRAIGFRE